MAKYMIRFDIPDNDTVIRELPHTFIEWSVWGYNGLSLPIPAADVRKNVHARWKKTALCKWACSYCCGEPYYNGSINDYKFCPFCGADMRGDNDV